MPVGNDLDIINKTNHLSPAGGKGAGQSPGSPRKFCLPSFFLSLRAWGSQALQLPKLPEAECGLGEDVAKKVASSYL